MAYNEDIKKPAGFIERLLPHAVIVLIIVGITIAWRYVKMKISYQKSDYIQNEQNE
jgi:hypothetical protein